MSGSSFDTPVVRLPRRFRFFATLLQSFANWAVAGVIDAGRRLTRSTLARDEVELPLAQIAEKLLERTLRGSRATGRASMDALRPQNHSVNLEDYYDNSYQREKLAPSAGRLPPQKRRPFAPSIHARRATSEEVLLAKSHRVLFRRWRNCNGTSGTIRAAGAQWFADIPVGSCFA